MLSRLYLTLVCLVMTGYLYSQSDGYLNVLNSGGTSGSTPNFNITYSIGETVTFDNSCNYTPGVVQPDCFCLVPVSEAFDQQYKARFYPNPAQTHVIIETDFQAFSNYFIYSVDGSLQQSGRYDYNPIKVDELAPGIYLLRLMTTDAHIFKTIKIIKQ